MRLIERLIKKDFIFEGNLKPVSRGFETKCWEWLGNTWSNGYARQSSRRMHRYAYELIYGKIKSGNFALHKCDNKLCCRPDHIYSGTHSQNMIDYKNRGVIDHSGEHNANSVLDNADVGVIRWLSEDLFFSSGILVNMYGVSKNTMLRICQYKTWREVKPLKLNKKEFIEYIARRRDNFKPLNKTLMNGFPNYRDCEDEIAVASFSYVYGSVEASKKLGIGRSSVRNAEDKHRNLFDYSINKGYRNDKTIKKAELANWLKWKKTYQHILDLL